MLLKEFALLTKEEAEKLCEKMYPKTKIVPILVHDENGNEFGCKYTKYYMVYVQLINNRWVPVLDIKKEYIK